MILTVTITPATPAQAVSLTAFQALAAAAAAAHLDALLFRRGAPPAPAFDPVVLLPALAAQGLTAGSLTLGLGASVPIDVLEPFHIARAFAAIDRLTNGRSALLLDADTTRDRAASPASPAMALSPDARRARRIELFEVVGKLLDSWEDEALLVDRPGGLFTDADRIHRIDHDGAHYTVRGPLNAPRPLQGAPVIFAPASIDPVLAATVADVVLVDAGTLRPPASERFALRLAELSPLPGETPSDLAARLRHSTTVGGCDGCNLHLAADPAALEAVVAAAALLDRPAWCGGTLRDRLGLPRRRSRYAA